MIHLPELQCREVAVVENRIGLDAVGDHNEGRLEKMPSLLRPGACARDQFAAHDPHKGFEQQVGVRDGVD